MAVYISSQNFPALFAAFGGAKSISVQAVQVANAEKLIEGGNIVAEGINRTYAKPVACDGFFVSPTTIEF